MWETKNTTTGIGVKLNKSASLYRAIQVFKNMIQGKTDPNDAFKLRFDNIYATTELANGESILRGKQLTKNGSQASMKDK